MVPTRSTIVRRAARLTRRGGVSVALAIVLAGCGANAPSGASPTSSAAAPSATTAASPTSAPSATLAPTATPKPTPTATAQPTPSPTASPNPAPPFACTKLPYRRPNDTLSVRIADVRVGTHPRYDRMVWEFRAGKLPDITVQTARPPFKLDPSDLPVTIQGKAFLKIRLTNVAVETVPAKADDLTPGYPMLVELRQTTGYEGDTVWIAGLSGPACVRVMILSSPARLVVDVAPAAGS